MLSKRTKSTAASLIASKRIAVALCAAIAMVLGAMSVGATMHTYPTNATPTSAPQTQVPPHANTTVLPGDTPAPTTTPSPKPMNQPKVQTQKVIKPLLLEPKDDDQEEHQSLLQLQVSPILQPVTDSVNDVAKSAGTLVTPPATTQPTDPSNTGSQATPAPATDTTGATPPTNTPGN